MKEKLPFSGSHVAYDLIYSAKDTKTEVEYLVRLVKDYGDQTNSIVEFGCGTGRHLRGLREYGFYVHGIDSSPEMVKKANGYDDGSVSEGDIRDVSCDMQYDAGMAIFHVVSYLTEQGGLERALKNTARIIKVGGLMIFDFWYKPCVMKQGASAKSMCAENNEMKVVRNCKPRHAGDSCIDVVFDFAIDWKEKSRKESFREIHRMRCYSLDEIETIGKRSGFELVRAEAWLTGKEPSDDEWGIVAIMRRVK